MTRKTLRKLEVHRATARTNKSRARHGAYPASLPLTERAFSDFFRSGLAHRIVYDAEGNANVFYDHRGDATSSSSTLLAKSSFHSARRAIVTATFGGATRSDVRQKLKSASAIAVIVLVPGSSWIHPIREFFVERFDSRWQTLPLDSVKTSQRKLQESSEVASDLAHGHPVVGFAAEQDEVPASLAAAVDLTIRIQPPGGATIGHAIRLFTGQKPPSCIEKNIAVGLEFHDLLAAFRIDSSPSEIIERIRKASAVASGIDSTKPLPKLEDAIEYGAARTWGLGLAKDIAAYRAGLLDWQEVDRGAVWYSEPGLGKSLLAQILAKTCGVPLVAFSVADLFASSPGYLDSVIKASRAMFQKAATIAPCILFLDEIDALPNRATMSPRGAEWWTPVITDFLLSLDNAVAGKRAGIVVCAATNNIKGVDTALLRPGRLERAIEIVRPDSAGAINILRYHLGEALAERNLADVAHLLDGCTGAEIMLVVRTARRIARDAKRELVLDDLLNAIAPHQDIAPAALTRICTHEAGHAVASVVIDSGDIKRCVVGHAVAESAGRTLIANPPDVDLMTRDTVERRVIVLLAGRAAERILIGNASVGSGGADDSDLALAAQSIAALHASAGLGDTLTYIVSYDDALTALRTDRELRLKVEQHLQVLQTRADNLVRDNRNEIQVVTDRLRIRRQLSGQQIRQIIKACGRTDAIEPVKIGPHKENGRS